MSKPEFPADHKPGMPVPKGGSSCASCKYYRGNMKCGNEYFIRWQGSVNIPAKSPDEYCSDWYEPKANQHPLEKVIGHAIRSGHA